MWPSEHNIGKFGGSPLRKIVLGAVSTAVLLGAMIPVAFADTNSSTLVGPKEVAFNGSPVSSPLVRVLDNTTYMPIWYVGQAIQSITGVTQTWNGNHRVWNITVPMNLPKDCFNIPIGAGNTTINVNGYQLKMVDTFVATDPASGRATVYMPIFYVQQILWDIGVLNTWDGTTWNIAYNPSTVSATYS